MRKFLILAAVAALTACAAPGEQRATYLNTMVGKPESELVRAFGVPSRSYEVAGSKFLAYRESRISSTPGVGYGYGYGWGRWGGYPYGYAGGIPPEIQQRDCETTFELVGGIVKTWTLRGNACN